MIEKIETGGPAFPTTTEHGFNCGEPDMTLRDYFAAKAMAACYAEYCAHANVQGYEEGWKVGVALDSYEMPDANAVPESMRRTFAEAFSGSSRAQAIKSKCLSCANFQREEVRTCPVVTCPLHSVRPYQQGEQDE